MVATCWCLVLQNISEHVVLSQQRKTEARILKCIATYQVCFEGRLHFLPASAVLAIAQVWNEDPGQLLAGPWSDAEFLSKLEQSHRGARGGFRFVEFALGVVSVFAVVFT